MNGFYDVKFCTEQRLKAYTSLDENVRIKDITPHILNAQDLYIQPLLGTKFYNGLKTRIANETLNAEEILFLEDYVSKTTIYYSLYLMLPHIKYKMVDKGLLNGASEDTSTTSLDELIYLRNTTKDTAEFFARRLVEYLRDNPGMFPEYANPGTDGMRPDKSTPYFSGLQTNIPRKTTNDCCEIKGPSTLRK